MTASDWITKFDDETRYIPDVNEETKPERHITCVFFYQKYA